MIRKSAPDYDMSSKSTEVKYGRTSMARTLMARLPWLFRTELQIKGDFLFYIENGMLCVLIRIASIRQF